MDPYGQPKTANARFALALDARGDPHGIRAFSVHAGAVAGTDLMRSLTEEEQRAASAAWCTGPKTTEQGAATSAWCAVSPQLDGPGGVCCEDADVAEGVPADFAGPHGVKP